MRSVFDLSRRVLGRGLAALSLLALVTGAATIDANRAAAQEEAVIEGFRSAKFGMSEKDVRAAILKDFGKGNKAITETVTAERTTVLTVETEDLLPGSGKSVIAYVLGYKSKKLMIINVVFGNSVDKDATETSVRSSAQTLARYFVDFGFDPKKVVANRPVSQNTVLAFQGEDAKGRLVRLLFSEFPMQPDPADTKKKNDGEARPKGYSLQLSYIKDVKKPDVFSIKKGMF